MVFLQTWTMLNIANMHLALMSKHILFSNSSAPGGLDCIYQRYNDNDVQAGDHELLHLPTNSLNTRRTVTPLPLTPAIINQMHTLAE